MFRLEDFHQSGVNNHDPVAIQSLLVEEFAKEQFHLSSSCVCKSQLAPMDFDRHPHPRAQKLGGLACLSTEVLQLDCEQRFGTLREKEILIGISNPLDFSKKKFQNSHALRPW